MPTSKDPKPASKDPKPTGYLDLGDGGIRGESKDADHKQWIEVRAYGYGPGGRSAVGTIKSGRNVTTSMTVFVPTGDQTSPVFMAYHLGTIIPKAALEVMIDEGGERTRSVRIDLKNVTVSGWQSSRGRDAYTLDFSSMSQTVGPPQSEMPESSFPPDRAMYDLSVGLDRGY
ncbi:type VI secretion system tube protein Hcp [Limnoglobus roseus]|uniref:Uncharacterized protein n=1 Tax=Limnoglobus roseus TaxID=2598579 RepID=A0A5C1A811_9BACT|nr:type VI secretion system tube protein Hcp [Limnoglobus roseus]QEL14635.1 hypothetical protein PX52LOC_01527 [Limnoglobus roseus]